jgi:hypothetical protein
MFRGEVHTLGLRLDEPQPSRFLANCQRLDRALRHAYAFRASQTLGVDDALTRLRQPVGLRIQSVRRRQPRITVLRLRHRVDESGGDAVFVGLHGMREFGEGLVPIRLRARCW